MSKRVNDTSEIRIERIWSMPNKNTFENKATAIPLALDGGLR